MAILITAWEHDGTGQCALAEARCATLVQVKNFTDTWKRSRKCVLITRTRTDKQSNVERTEWKREGYVDPTDFVREA